MTFNTLKKAYKKTYHFSGRFVYKNINSISPYRILLMKLMIEIIFNTCLFVQNQKKYLDHLIYFLNNCTLTSMNIHEI